MKAPAKKFRNAYEHTPHGFIDILKWKLGKKIDSIEESSDQPPFGTSIMSADKLTLTKDGTTPPEASIRLIWIGHSTFLIQHMNRNILTDPIFGRCQPLPIRGLRRAVPPGISFDDIPHIDDVLISHSHYDHLDLATMRTLGYDVRYWTPEGLSPWFRRQGISGVRLVAVCPSFPGHCHPQRSCPTRVGPNSV